MIAGELLNINYCDICGVRLPEETKKQEVHFKTMHKQAGWGGEYLDRGWDFCQYCGVRIKREHMDSHVRVFHRRGPLGPGQT